MSTKAFSAIVIKSIDEDQRVIEGVATTPSLDRVKDSVKPEGMRYAKEIPLLLNHDHSKPVGTVSLGKATTKGIPFRAQIAKVEDDGEVKKRTDEAWHSVKAQLIKGVSIGFRPEDYEPNKAGGLDFTKAEIYELSLVAIPCNPDAVITAFKSLAEADAQASAEVPDENQEQNPDAATAAAAEQRAQEEAEASRKALDVRRRKLLLSLN
ncbi:HK97 family phage prohead protease [Burkholderia cenocepacia]|uniref:HK97 family phage prohead protease n=1 Tax=Burkholderia cenocepacia TaxID=95486 RepID=UPI0038CBF953